MHHGKLLLFLQSVELVVGVRSSARLAQLPQSTHPSQSRRFPSSQMLTPLPLRRVAATPLRAAPPPRRSTNQVARRLLFQTHLDPMLRHQREGLLRPPQAESRRWLTQAQP